MSGIFFGGQLVVALFVKAWAGLCFSDLQRLYLPSVALRDGLGFSLVLASREL